MYNFLMQLPILYIKTHGRGQDTRSQEDTFEFKKKSKFKKSSNRKLYET